MRPLAAIFACLLLGLILLDGFYTVILARRTERAFRLTVGFYRFTWRFFVAVARRIETGKHREEFLSVYGPLSLLALLGCWALGGIVAFGLLHWAAGLQVRDTHANLLDAFYFSGTTLFAVGSPDARNTASKILSVLEAGMGICSLGLVVGYLPVLYQSYANREHRIFLLDARAGSPPSACELLVRQGGNPDKLETQLVNWEEWAADLLQNQLSYPMLSYFRSQHVNQSWLAALVAILDATSVVVLSARDDLKRQAEATFAMARHAVADLARIFQTEAAPPPADRLSPADFDRLKNSIEAADTPLHVRRLRAEDLKHLRDLYEPYAAALGAYFLIALPPWLPREGDKDNWRSTGWKPSARPFAVSDPFTSD